MHVPEDELSQYLIAQLPENRTCEIESHLAICPTCVGTLASKAPSSTRTSGLFFERLEQERQSGKPGWLQRLNPFSSQQCPAWLIDASPSGIRVMVEGEVAPRTLVRLCFQGLVLIGTVRHQDFASDCYYLSLKIIAKHLVP